MFFPKLADSAAKPDRETDCQFPSLPLSLVYLFGKPNNAMRRENAVVSFAISVAAFLFLCWVALQIFSFACTVLEGLSNRSDGATIFFLVLVLAAFVLWRLL